jgi:catalase
MEPPLKLTGDAYRFDHRDGNEDYRQAGDLYRLMNADQQSQLIQNLVEPLHTVPRFIQVRQLRHFYQADADYGTRMAKGLGIPIDEVTGHAP